MRADPCGPARQTGMVSRPLTERASRVRALPQYGTDPLAHSPERAGSARCAPREETLGIVRDQARDGRASSLARAVRPACLRRAVLSPMKLDTNKRLASGTLVFFCLHVPTLTREGARLGNSSLPRASPGVKGPSEGRARALLGAPSAPLADPRASLGGLRPTPFPPPHAPLCPPGNLGGGTLRALAPPCAPLRPSARPTRTEA
jgi:hypothetical protein